MAQTPSNNVSNIVSLREGIDPSDPAYAIVAAVRDLQKQSLVDLGGLVRTLSVEIAATAAVAEQASRASAERLITEAAGWVGDEIRAAGRTVGTDIAAVGVELHAEVATLRRLVGTMIGLTVLFSVVGLGVGLILLTR